tara:strand:- start:35 stop:622 length:588 start_codon:yes stop_codon:yes gene_type:complete
MANLQELHLQPIANAAAALNLDNDATPNEIAKAATTAIKELANLLDRLEVADATVIPLIPEWKEASTTLRNIASSQGSELSRRLMESTNGKSKPVIVETDHGPTVCTPRVSITREFDREDLIRAVERSTSIQENRLNPDGSGELLDYDSAKVVLFKKVFRMEPRWTELKKIGVDTDMYSNKKTSYTVQIESAKTL